MKANEVREYTLRNGLEILDEGRKKDYNYIVVGGFGSFEEVLKAEEELEDAWPVVGYEGLWEGARNAVEVKSSIFGDYYATEYLEDGMIRIYDDEGDVYEGPRYKMELLHPQTGHVERAGLLFPVEEDDEDEL